MAIQFNRFKNSRVIFLGIFFWVPWEIFSTSIPEPRVIPWINTVLTSVTVLLGPFFSSNQLDNHYQIDKFPFFLSKKEKAGYHYFFESCLSFQRGGGLCLLNFSVKPSR
jgi:hypothetical protein